MKKQIWLFGFLAVMLFAGIVQNNVNYLYALFISLVGVGIYLVFEGQNG